MRESPALKIIELLRERGADVGYHDPHVPELPRARPAQRRRSPTALDGADLAVIVTAHPRVDHRAIAERARSRSTCAASPARWARARCSSN